MAIEYRLNRYCLRYLNDGQLRRRVQLQLKRGESRHDVPPTGVFGSGRHRRPVAYVFSQAEVRRIIGAALELAPKASLRPHTNYTLLGLLAATGLRIGEALRLRLDDITPDGLEIRETKFRKSRQVRS